MGREKREKGEKVKEERIKRAEEDTNQREFGATNYYTRKMTTLHALEEQLGVCHPP